MHATSLLLATHLWLKLSMISYLMLQSIIDEYIRYPDHNTIASYLRLQQICVIFSSVSASLILLEIHLVPNHI